MMKLAFAATGNDVNAPLSAQFGRAPKFLIHDTKTGASEIIENQQNLNAAQGAGIQSAEAIARSGAEALIVGHCGPKAFRALTAAGIQIYYSNARTIAGALEEFKDGKLQAAALADVEGHWV